MSRHAGIIYQPKWGRTKLINHKHKNKRSRNLSYDYHGDVTVAPLAGRCRRSLMKQHLSKVTPEVPDMLCKVGRDELLRSGLGVNHLPLFSLELETLARAGSEAQTKLVAGPTLN